MRKTNTATAVLERDERLQDQTGGPIEDLAARTQQLIKQGYATPGLAGLFTQFTANDPQLVVTIDREQAKALTDEAEQRCPYSNAVRGNVEVTLTLL